MVRSWDSHAGLVPILASMSGLGLLQGLVLLGLNRNFPGERAWSWRFWHWG